MQTMMWHKQRIIYMIAISLLAYMMLRKKTYHLEDTAILPSVKAEIVWEFLADFSNVKKYLVPHIHNFSITAESGNYDHWQYSVKYEEPIPVWPYFDSHGTGHYSIKIQGDNYLIESQHTTCVFFGLACSKSDTKFYIKQIKQDTKYIEEVAYECPPLFNFWCSNAAEYTRKDFIKNLVNHFKIKRT